MSSSGSLAFIAMTAAFGAARYGLLGAAAGSFLGFTVVVACALVFAVIAFSSLAGM